MSKAYIIVRTQFVLHSPIYRLPATVTVGFVWIRRRLFVSLTLRSSLTELLAKDATADDPGRVINISSVAAAHTLAMGSSLAGAGNGLWSCECESAQKLVWGVNGAHRQH